jgi:hypothetical protein
MCVGEPCNGCWPPHVSLCTIIRVKTKTGGEFYLWWPLKLAVLSCMASCCGASRYIYNLMRLQTVKSAHNWGCRSFTSLVAGVISIFSLFRQGHAPKAAGRRWDILTCTMPESMHLHRTTLEVQDFIPESTRHAHWQIKAYFIWNAYIYLKGFRIQYKYSQEEWKKNWKTTTTN